MKKKVIRTCQCGTENHIRQKKCTGCSIILRATEGRRHMKSFHENKQKGVKMDPMYIFNKIQNRVEQVAGHPGMNILVFCQFPTKKNTKKLYGLAQGSNAEQLIKEPVFANIFKKTLGLTLKVVGENQVEETSTQDLNGIPLPATDEETAPNHLEAPTNEVEENGRQVLTGISPAASDQETAPIHSEAPTNGQIDEDGPVEATGMTLDGESSSLYPEVVTDGEQAELRTVQITYEFSNMDADGTMQVDLQARNGGNHIVDSMVPETSGVQAVEQAVEQGSDVYTVKEILGRRRDIKDRRSWQYHIKWAGFPDSENSWVSTKDIIDKKMLNRFIRSLKK